MPKIYFDLNSGGLFESVHGSVQPEHAQALGDILLSDVFTFEKGAYPRISSGEWDKETGITIGQIIVNELVRDDEPVAFSKEIIHRLSILGIFPDYNYIRTTFKTLSNFSEVVGGASVNPNREYDDLSTADLLELVITRYNEAVDSPNGIQYRGPFTHATLATMQSTGLIPSRKYMRSRIGGVTKINDLLGYPDVRSWDVEDYIEYGIKVMFFNGTDSLTVRNIEALCTERFGPSAAAVKRKFGTWGDYKRVCQNIFDKEFKALKERGDRIVDFCKSSLDKEFDNLEFKTKALHYGLSMLLYHFVPGSDIGRRPLLSIDNVIAKIKENRPNITLADIEIHAITIHIFDDIWPTKTFSRPPIIPAD